MFHKLLKKAMAKDFTAKFNACRDGRMTKDAFVSFYTKNKAVDVNTINAIYDDIMAKVIADDEIMDQLIDALIAMCIRFMKK